MDNTSQDPQQWSGRKVLSELKAGRLTEPQRRTIGELQGKALSSAKALQSALKHKHGQIQAIAERLGIHGLNLADPQDWARLEAVMRKFTGLQRGELLDLAYRDELLGYLAAAVEQAGVAAGPEQPAGAGDGKPTGRKGRLRAADAESQKMAMLAKCSAHPTLMNDVAALAKSVGVSESTCRRWLTGFREQNHRAHDDEE